jgi:uncharacterized protein (DUF1501 family)
MPPTCRPCSDYTRSQAVRAAIASAGRGLPAIEPGMPVPAGSGMTRRSMLLRSAGLAMAVYGARQALTPEAVEAAVAEAAGPHRVIVSVFMDGGADNLSLLAPVGHPRYAALRPSLGLAEGATLPFEADPSLRWHPAAEGLKALWDEPGVGLAVAPAIGYSSPNQSHFTSRHFWEVGGLDPIARTGWLGRYLDRVGSPNVPIQGLSLSSTLSPQLATGSVAVAATDSLGGYSFSSRGVGGEMQQRMRTAVAQLGGVASTDPATATALQVQRNAATLVGDLAAASGAAATPAEAGYPTTSSGLRTRLQSLARLLDAEVGGQPLPVRAVTVRAEGGYDTHSRQAPAFANGLRATADNLRAFWRDLVLRGLDDRVVVLLWTEFGRRPYENGSAGTDHGAAGSAFVIGKHVRQGLIGEFPGLEPGTGIDAQGNLRNTADFRGLYCALLEQWMQTEWQGIIADPGPMAIPALVAA